jgi:hypothetical protein
MLVKGVDRVNDFALQCSDAVCRGGTGVPPVNSRTDACHIQKHDLLWVVTQFRFPLCPSAETSMLLCG